MAEKTESKAVFENSENGTINLIGVISDTHNLLRSSAIEALREADLIIHAGDICSPHILEKLKSLAPVVAVRGNNDKGAWAEELSVSETVNVGGAVSIFVIHDFKEMDADARAAGFKIVISGHSHKPSLTEENGVFYLNPGSAGPRRFKLPVSVALIELSEENFDIKIVELEA
jgi:putative phosphoesterase